MSRFGRWKTVKIQLCCTCIGSLLVCMVSQESTSVYFSCWWNNNHTLNPKSTLQISGVCMYFTLFAPLYKIVNLKLPILRLRPLSLMPHWRIANVLHIETTTSNIQSQQEDVNWRFIAPYGGDCQRWSVGVTSVWSKKTLDAWHPSWNHLTFQANLHVDALRTFYQRGDSDVLT